MSTDHDRSSDLGLCEATVQARERPRESLGPADRPPNSRSLHARAVARWLRTPSAPYMATATYHPPKLAQIHHLVPVLHVLTPPSVPPCPISTVGQCVSGPTPPRRTPRRVNASLPESPLGPGRGACQARVGVIPSSSDQSSARPRASRLATSAGSSGTMLVAAYARRDALITRGPWAPGARRRRTHLPTSAVSSRIGRAAGTADDAPADCDIDAFGLLVGRTCPRGFAPRTLYLLPEAGMSSKSASLASTAARPDGEDGRGISEIATFAFDCCCSSVGGMPAAAATATAARRVL
ncbi:hypothetical protein BC628DRAFT_251984 [Trametes gibbosa]|nr:hypothetical protein BC628DRAFT_251984 [Trametes gibbosa]